MRQGTRFGRPQSLAVARGLDAKSARVEVFTPTRGLHRGDAAQDLQPGYTPDASNFVVSGGGLTPRSGLSRWRTGSSQVSGPAIGSFRVSDLTGFQYLIGASDRTISVHNPNDDSWTALSSHTTQSDVPSGTSREYWDSAYLYDAAADRNLAVLTNHKDVPKVFVIEPSVTTYSNLTDFTSLASKARSVCAFDNRLVWFNMSTDSLAQPSRVLWSVRGQPRNYQLLDGAGFEDLLDMRGIGTRVIAEREGVVLFSDEEIWRGRKRGDAYVFDFYPVSRNVGCPYPRTIVQTPLGTIFLSFDLELYLLQGDAVRPLGPQNDGEASRIQLFLQENLYDAERAWAVYNPAKVRYELFYTGSESAEGYPTRGLFYHLIEESFFPQTFSHELPSGVEFKDQGVPSTWDATVATWDEVATSWDEQVTAGNGYSVHPFSSAGTSYRFEDAQTDDDGSRITAYWTSHAMNRDDQIRMERFTELWVEHKQASASSASVTFAPDLSFSGAETYNTALGAGDYGRTLVTGFASGAAPHFKVQVTDGGTPKFMRFQAKLVEGGLYS
jgi:hypothetical protein